MALDDDDNQQEEAIQADMEARADPFAAWEQELEDDQLAELRAEVAEGEYDPDIEAEFDDYDPHDGSESDLTGTTTSVTGSSNELVEAEGADEEGEGPEFESRMEARTVVVHDAPPHVPLIGNDRVDAQHWTEFFVDPTQVGSNEQDDMLTGATTSVALRDSLIGALWPEGYTDPNGEIPVATSDAELVARVAQTEELITHQIANTEPWAMAIVAHITAKLRGAAVITGAVGAPWITQFLSLDEDDVALLESAKGIDPNVDTMIQIYLDCIKVARVAG